MCTRANVYACANVVRQPVCVAWYLPGLRVQIERERRARPSRMAVVPARRAPCCACGTGRGHQAHALARGPITSLLGLYSLQKASQLAKLGMCQQHAEFRMASCGQHPCALYYKPACRGSCATDDAPSLQDTGQKLPRMLRVQSHAHNIYPSICLSISSPSLPMHLQNIARKRPAALCVAGTRALREGARKRTIS
jgi:hypothetical protein